ncbi:MAG: hypothetical protein JJ979_02775 [Roseibium sp.]|nr:hypothetical protein [Roseibium sp.]
MAIIYPRALSSSLKIQAEDFRVERSENVNRRRGGKTQVSERADPRWFVDWETYKMDMDEFQDLEAWLLSLRGGLKSFLAYRHERPYPKDYRFGFNGLSKHFGGAFTGTCVVDAIAQTGLTVSGLPSTFSVRAGDMIGLIQSGKYGLHVVLEDAIASAGAVSLLVEPFIKTNIFSTAATANFAQPLCEMILTSYSGPRSIELETVSITAVQKIY